MLQINIGCAPAIFWDYSDENAATALSHWTKVHDYFSKPEATQFYLSGEPEDWWSIRPDVTPLMRAIEAARIADAAGRPLGGETWKLTLRVEAAGASAAGNPPWYLIDRFLQQLFLATTIVYPWMLELDDHKSVENGQRWSLVLSPALVGEAWIQSKGSWPLWQDVPFPTSWNWFHEDLFYDMDVAETPSQGACFSLLRICSGNTEDPAHLLFLAQAIEGLFPEHTSSRRVKAGIARIIGRPPDNPDWYRDFYRLRSQMVHGHAPIVRPGSGQRTPRIANRLAELYPATIRAVAALVVLVQSLILEDRRSFAES